MFKEWCQAESLEHILTTTGVVRGNGQVERLNRVVLGVISKLSADRSETWYKYVSKVQSVVNSTVNKSTKYTPFQLMFGVEMKTALEVNINEILEAEMREVFMADRDETRTKAREEIVRAQSEYKRNFGKRRKKETEFNVGDLVAIKRTQFISGKKLANEYLGPYEVTKCKCNGLYDVKKAANFEGPNNTSTSCDFMRPWREEEVDLSGTKDGLVE